MIMAVLEHVFLFMKCRICSEKNQKLEIIKNHVINTGSDKNNKLQDSRFSPGVSDPLKIQDISHFLLLEVLGHLSKVQGQGQNVLELHQLNRILANIGLEIYNVREIRYAHVRGISILDGNVCYEMHDQ